MMTSRFTLALVVVVLTLTTPALCGKWNAPAQTNMQPVIGILSQPTAGTLAKYGDQYIAASYIKWVEAGGGLAVPIPYDTPTAELKEIYESINGFLLPGGGVALGNNVYTRNYQQMLTWALEENSAGGWFPVWGTCFGFQEIAMWAGASLDLLSPTDSENITLPLHFVGGVAGVQDSELFGSMPSSVLEIYAQQAVTMNNHHYSLTPKTYNQTHQLQSFFDVLSTNTDRNGVEFISTMEAKEFPFALSQWHPEKPLFEHPPVDVEGINHSSDSIRANVETALFFISLARSNNHAYPSHEARANALIFNYPVVYTEPNDFNFDQCYFFKNR